MPRKKDETGASETGGGTEHLTPRKKFPPANLKKVEGKTI